MPASELEVDLSGEIIVVDPYCFSRGDGQVIIVHALIEAHSLRGVRIDRPHDDETDP